MTKKVTSPPPVSGRKPRVIYSDELLAQILEKVALGEPLSRICDSPDMPTRKSFFEWVAGDPSILVQYEFALQMRADLYAEEVIAIADDGRNDTYFNEAGDQVIRYDVLARCKLRIDARKWCASKLAPKKYGDAVKIEGAKQNPVQIISDAALNTDWESLRARVEKHELSRPPAK